MIEGQSSGCSIENPFVVSCVGGVLLECSLISFYMYLFLI